MTVIQYEHHGRKVWVDAEAKGQHRKYCLCFRGCQNFKPDSPENCPIAQKLFKFDVTYGMTTPVYECPEYVAPQQPESAPTHGFFEWLREAVEWNRRWWAN